MEIKVKGDTYERLRAYKKDSETWGEYLEFLLDRAGITAEIKERMGCFEVE